MQFGVEIEFFGVTREVVRMALVEEGIAAKVENYNHTTRRHWKLTTDSSVTNRGTGSSYGNELVSPILKGEQGLAELERVCAVLNKVGAKVDKTCGVHVHHDINDLNVEQIKNIYRIYKKYEMVIESMMPKSRRAEYQKTTRYAYCQPITDEYLENVEKCETIADLREVTYDRYKTINFTAYVKYGTIEFRQHGGSTEFEKIGNWVRITNAIIEKARSSKKVKPIKGEITKNDINRMIQRFKRDMSIEGATGKYILERIKKLRAS